MAGGPGCGLRSQETPLYSPAQGLGLQLQVPAGERGWGLVWKWDIRSPTLAPVLPSPPTPRPTGHPTPLHAHTGSSIQPTLAFLVLMWPSSGDWALLSSLGQSPAGGAGQPPMTPSIFSLQTWAPYRAGGHSGLEQPSYGVSQTENSSLFSFLSGGLCLPGSAPSVRAPSTNPSPDLTPGWLRLERGPLGSAEKCGKNHPVSLL